jgi:valyl-tRNA synthetase
MLDKTFQSEDLEARIGQKWDQQNAFAAGANAKEGADTFCIMIPPPNVTGSLHMGHALNNTLQDILVRWKRMQGFDVLWQPGMDHAGIATQMVVERQLAANKEPDRRTMGREAFIERIWEWKERSGGTIFNQLKRLGASCDWSRERFTMDEGLSEAVREVFVSLYEDGLIYKDKRLVNWDPKLQTALSDLEVEMKETPGKMWHFAYPLDDGPVDGRSEIVIATTRPETMLGDGAVAVHPSDERYKNLIGKMVRLPVADRLIPIIADDYPDPEFGSGAVKITGAHDFNDFEVARRNNIPFYPLMDKQARMDGEAVPERYKGLDRYEARKTIVAEIEAMGLLRDIEEREFAQPFGDRSGVVLEPMLTDQWYLDAKTLAGPALESVKEGRTNFVPKNWEKTYFEWMNNIQPWCISRQLWWGHQIPAWYGPDDKIFVAKDEKTALDQAVQHYLAHEGLYKAEIERRIENYDFDGFLTRDPDVLDTWFSSALWPFSTLGWPEKTPELERYYQTDVLITGFDIIFFWVARMMMMGNHFMEEEPFHTVYIHALVRDEKGAKMSKSKGNVMDPLELIDEYGADSLRFTLAAMAAQGRDIKLAKSRVEGYRNFGTKLWNATRFCQMNDCVHVQGFRPEKVATTLNRWILTELAKTIEEIDNALADYRFNEAASSAYRFVWNQFCDWFVELAKPVFNSDDEDARAETKATAAFVLDEIFKLLHPFMPFITEELWDKTSANWSPRKDLLCHTSWPDFAFSDQDAATQINWLVEAITAIRSVRAEMRVPAGAKVPLVVIGANAQTTAWLDQQSDALKRLARLSDISISQETPQEAAQIIHGEAILALPLSGIVDLDAERQRLKKNIETLESDISKIDKKLANEHFLAKAPEDVVQGERDRRHELIEEKDKTQIALERLG